MNTLLTGFDESDGRVTRLLKQAGYLEQRLSFCVALVRSTDPVEMESPPRVRRIMESVAQAVAPLPLRALLGTRDNLVAVVFSDTRRSSGWTAPQSALSSRVRSAALLLGPSVLIGLSTDQPSTACIPKGLGEARVALDFASVNERVLCYSELTLRRLTLHHAAGELRAGFPSWLTSLVAADSKAHGSFTGTMRALADCDLNVQHAARTLQLHPNTVYARMERIKQLTGFNCQRHHDLSELLLGLDLFLTSS
jgi:sugar diacid utilization regulator